MSLDRRVNELFVNPSKYLQNIYGYFCIDEFADEALERQSLKDPASFPVINWDINMPNLSYYWNGLVYSLSRS